LAALADGNCWFDASGGGQAKKITPPDEPPATTGGNVTQLKVLVAEFDGPDPKNNRVTDTILQKLQQAAGNSQTLKILPLKQAITQAEGKDKARELGKAQNADIVIWGWYGKTQEKVIVSVNFEMLSAAKDYLPLGKQTQGDIRTMAVASLERFEMQVNLAEELKYLTLVTVGVSAYAADDWDNAIAQLTTALPDAKRNKAALDPAAIYLYRGTAYYFKREYGRAIADYSQAILLNPKLEVAFYNRGNAYDKKGEYDRAIADFNQAILLNPQDAYAFINRGTAYNKKGEYDRAIADFTQAINLNPKYADAFYNRGIAYYFKREYDRAIADFNQAILLNPKDAGAFYNRGLAYELKGDKVKAIESYRQALALAQTPQVKEVAQRKLKELEAN
jgi:tetratricopeptide (TPR) repeat protein